MTSLMPCPFCGGAAIRCGQQPEDLHTCHHILCTKCRASFDMAMTVDPNNDTHETVEALEAACIEAFNRRTTVSTQKGAITQDTAK